MSAQTEVLLAEILSVCKQILVSVSAKDEFVRIRLTSFAKNMGIGIPALKRLCSGLGIEPTRSGHAYYLTQEQAVELKRHMESPAVMERIRAATQASARRKRRTKAERENRLPRYRRPDDTGPSEEMEEEP